MSQFQFAVLSGISQTTISKYERNEYAPERENTRKIAEATKGAIPSSNWDPPVAAKIVAA